MAYGYLGFAVLAAFFWALGNVLDKSVLTDHIKDPVVVTFFTGMFGGLFAFVLPVLGLVRIPSPLVLSVTLALGVLYILPIYFYMKGMKLEEVSRVIPIMNISPVFVVLLGAIFLNEVFTFTKYFGIFLAITASIMVSSKRFGKEFFHLKANKAYWMILSGSVLFAVYTVGTRWILGSADFWNVFFWSRIGGMIPLGFMMMHQNTRDNILSILKNAGERKLGYLGVSELLNDLGLLSQTLALSLGAAALVKTVTTIQPVFVLVFVGFLKYLWDKDLGDDLSRKAVIIKTVSAFMILVGIYLIR